MRKFTKEEKKVLRQIAGFYGCKVEFTNENWGRFCGDYILVGHERNRDYSFSIFFHELAHFINSKTDKYPIYHDHRNWPKEKLITKFKSFDHMVRYALDAEIYTEKAGKRLMNEWFPEMKYIGWYKNNNQSYAFLMGYLL